MRFPYLFLFLLASIAIQAQEYIPSLHLDQSSGLALNTVSCLEEDSLGRIWVGTSAGLYVYDGQALIPVATITERVLNLQFQNGRVFCVTLQAVYVIDSSAEIVSHQDLPSKDYYESVFLREGIFLFASRSKDSVYLDFDLHPLPLNELDYESSFKDSTSIFEAPFGPGKVHVGLYGTYVDLGYEKLISRAICADAMVYASNRMFVASQEGLIELCANEKGLSEHKYFENERIECLLKDRSGNLWFGTAAHGLFMLHRNALHARFYPELNEQREAITCWGMVDYSGESYTTTSFGMRRIPPSKSADPLESVTAGFACFTAASSEGFILIGTGRQGIYRYQNERLTQVYFNSEESLDNTVVQIIKTESGFLAVSKFSVIQLNHFGDFISSKTNKELGVFQYIMSMRPMAGGYLASTTSGVVQFDSNLQILHSYTLPDSRVFCMSTSFQGEDWFVSMDGGLLKLSKDSLQVQWAEDRHLYTLFNINDEALWISSGTSIYRYSNESTRPFNQLNGFPIHEYNQSGVYHTAEGELRFAGLGGVIEFQPDQMAYMPQLPSTLVSMDNEPIDDLEPIELSYDQSKVSLAFLTVLHADENLFEMAYRCGEEWIIIGKAENVFIDVPFGQNVLEWRVKNVVTDEQNLVTWKLNRELPIWQKTWFRGVLLLLSVLLLGGLYALFEYLRTRTLLNQEREERKLSQERLRISRELHDNIGARLTHIISSLDLEMRTASSAKNELENINAFARDTMSQLRETIWAVGDQTIFLSEWARRTAHYVNQANTLTAMELSYQQTIKGDAELSALETINFYRIMQEAVNNAVKYSEASKAEVSVVFDGALLCFTISDDGKGFDTESAARGMGLKSMRDRAAEAKAQISLKSKPGEGASISVTWKVE